jgi:hypothetical protein
MGHITLFSPSIRENLLSDYDYSGGLWKKIVLKISPPYCFAIAKLRFSHAYISYILLSTLGSRYEGKIGHGTVNG